MAEGAGGVEEDRIAIVVSVEAGDSANILESIDTALDGISSHAKSASSALNGLPSDLADKLKGLQDAAVSMQKAFSGLTDGGFSKDKAEALGQSIAAMAGSMSEGLKGLEDIDASKLGSLALGLSSISEAAGNVSISPDKIAQLKAMLDSVAGASARAAEVGHGVESLGRGLSKIPDALQKFAKTDFMGSAEGLMEALGIVNDAMETVPNISANAAAATNIGYGIRALYNGLKLFMDGDLSGAARNVAGTLKTLQAVFGNATGMESMGEGVKALGTGIRQLHNGLMLFSKDDYGPKIYTLTNVLGGLIDTMDRFTQSGGGEATKAIAALGKGLSSFANAINKLDGADDKLKGVAEELGEFAKNAQASVSDEELSRFERLANALDKATEAYQHLNAAENAASKANMGFGGKFLQAILGGALNGAANLISRLADSMKDLAQKGWGALVSGAQKYLSLMCRIVTIPLSNIKSGFDSIKGSLDGLLGTIGRIIMYRALRGVLSQIVNGFNTGLQNLYQWALISGNAFVGTMDSMASSMQYFQNSVSGAASELLDALAPALETIVNWAVSALNAINQLLAALTGHGVWRKAVRTQKSFAAATGGGGNSAANGAKKATKAVKEYERTVLGFDELNKMNKPDASDSSGGNGGGGGGGGGADIPDYGSMFEEEPIDDFYKNLANTDNWTELGKRIADGLNSWESQIDWDSINKTAATWSKRIWTAFNGFVHERDWSLFGHTIAQGLNVGLRFIDDIAQNADFTAFGAGIAGALNRAVIEIDPNALGHVMTDRLKVSLEILHGFMNGDSTYEAFNFDKLRERLNYAIDAAFRNIDWNTAIADVTNGLAQLARTFVSGINRVIENIDLVVQNFNWVQWGSDVAVHLNEAILSIDWGAVGRFLSDGLKVAFEGLHGALQTFNWTEFGNGIQTAITEAFNNIDWSQAGTDINNLANHLLDVVEQAIAAINWSDLDAFIAGLNIPQLLMRCLGIIAKGMWDVFVNQFESGVWPLILTFVALKGAALGLKILAEIEKWTIVAKLLGVGQEGGEGLAGGLFEKFSGAGLGESIKEWIAEHIGAGGTVTAAGSAGSAIGTAIGAAVGIGLNLDGLHKQITDGFSIGAFAETTAGAALAGASIGFAFGGPLGAGIGAAIGAIVSGVETIVANWQQISDWINQNILPGFQQFFDGLKECMDNLVKGIGDKLSALGQAILDAVNWLWDHVPQPVKDVLSGIVDFFHKTFGPTPAEAKEYGSDTGEGLSEGMDGKSQDVGDSASGLAEKIRSGIGGAVSNASTWGANVAQYVSGGMGQFAGNALSAASGIAGNIQSGIGTAVNAAGSWGSSVASYVAGGIGSMAGRVSSAAGNVARNIGNILGGIWRSASGWGKDITTGIANGLWGGIRTVSNAARSVAQTIRNFLHFSEPDIGPLSNFHTYMPDMMRSMAEGIDRNSYLVTDSLQNLTGGMKLSIGTSYDVGDMPDAGDLISEAVERGVVSVVLGQSSDSDKGTTVVLRVDSEDLAKAVMRGKDRLKQRNPLAFA